MSSKIVSLPPRPVPLPADPDSDPLSGEQIAEFLYYAHRLDQADSPAEMHLCVRAIRNLVASWPDG